MLKYKKLFCLFSVVSESSTEVSLILVTIYMLRWIRLKYNQILKKTLT